MRVHRIDKTRRSSFYFKWSLAIIIFGSIYVWQGNESRRLGYKISDTNERILSLSEENKYLTMKIMDITAMDNLEEIARKWLGLVAPKPSDIVIIEESK